MLNLLNNENDERRTFFNPDELREFCGLVYLETIDPTLSNEERQNFIRDKSKAFDEEYNHWKTKALLQPDNSPQKDIFNGFSEIAKFQAEKLRLENNIRPETEEVTNILNENAENSDLGRLERFKKFAKENLSGLSAVAISVAGIITAIVIRARNALKQGVKAVGSLAKAIANIGKNFGAVISAVLNLISQILLWGAKGIAFIAKNLWILVIAITYFLYNEYRQTRKKR